MALRGDLVAKAVVADTCAVWNVLSSRVLHGSCINSGFEFALTVFVLYECLHKPRKEVTEEDARLQDRLRTARAKGQFKSYELSIEDLQDVAILEQRKRLSKGELASMAFARRVNLSFQTDDQGARKLASSVLGPDRVQTTPHVLGWLVFSGRLGDGDLSGIVEEHESFERPLRPYFEDLYREAMRCRLVARSNALQVSPGPPGGEELASPGGEDRDL
jgi:hypothetical protein